MISHHVVKFIVVTWTREEAKREEEKVTRSSGMRKPSKSQYTNSCKISCCLSDAVGAIWRTGRSSWTRCESWSHSHSLSLKPWSAYCSGTVSYFRRRINRVIAKVSEMVLLIRYVTTRRMTTEGVIDRQQRGMVMFFSSLPRSMTARLSIDPNMARGMTFFTIAWTNDVTCAARDTNSSVRAAQIISTQSSRGTQVSALPDQKMSNLSKV